VIKTLTVAWMLPSETNSRGIKPSDRNIEWIIGPRSYHPDSSQCFYHWVDTSAGGLLVPEVIIHTVVSVTITGSIPLLVDY
jgi:hypothetical protein